MHPVLDALAQASRKGTIFETVMVHTLKDMGFSNVFRQQSGSQFGFDIYAELDDGLGEPTVWLFECKNQTPRLTPRHIAPKLIWHYRKSRINMFVIATTSELNNDSLQLLNSSGFPFPVQVWQSEFLANLIAKSPQSLSALGLETSEMPEQTSSAKAISFGLTAPAILDVYHQLDPPFSFHFFRNDFGIAKCYSEFEFRVNFGVHNPNRAPIDVHNIRCRTAYFEGGIRRVLAQMKFKGLYDPSILSFKPAAVTGGDSIVTEQMLRVAGKNSENITLVLDNDTTPGYYQISFHASVRFANRVAKNLQSPLFPLYVPDARDSKLKVYVVSKHYDHMAEHLLDLPDPIWDLLVTESTKENQIVFLGPTIHDLATFQRQSTWQLKVARIDRATGRIAETHTLLHDLEIPADERMHFITREQMEAEWKKMGLMGKDISE